MEAVVFVLSTLGDVGRSFSTEEIADRVHQLLPGRFGWRRPEYRKKGWPDKYIVKTALEDAKKLENGGLVEGSYALDQSRDGWRVTPEGARWASQNGDRIRSALNVQHASLPSRDSERFLRTIRNEPLFSQFIQTRAVDSARIYWFTDMLRCSPDASPDIITTKFRQLQAKAELVGDEDILEFLHKCAAAFTDILPPKSRKSKSEGSSS